MQRFDLISDNSCFFSQTDLISTIGESVALGAAGIILWGDASYASSSVSICILD